MSTEKSEESRSERLKRTERELRRRLSTFSSKHQETYKEDADLALQRLFQEVVYLLEPYGISVHLGKTPKERPCLTFPLQTQLTIDRTAQRTEWNGLVWDWEKGLQFCWRFHGHTHLYKGSYKQNRLYFDPGQHRWVSSDKHTTPVLYLATVVINIVERGVSSDSSIRRRNY